MDDQQAYLLNGLLARQYGLGRVVRFRAVTRGRQAASYEIFTAQEREYLVQLYPHAIRAEQLESVAEKVNRLDRERFSVVPFVAGKNGRHIGEGPQGAHLMVTLAPQGSTLPPDKYSEQDISQIGLRLGWMHRLLLEQFPEVPPTAPMAQRVEEAMEASGARAMMSEDDLQHFLGMLAMPLERGWVHGDFQAAALLLDGDHQLRTIVDWGLLHAGTPLEDLVDAFLALCTGANGRLLLERGRSLMEAYATLMPIKTLAWTPVVAMWCAQRLLDAGERRRSLPGGFEVVLRRPEGIATAMASCL